MELQLNAAKKKYRLHSKAAAFTYLPRVDFMPLFLFLAAATAAACAAAFDPAITGDGTTPGGREWPPTPTPWGRA